jgi:hypothetical protein
MPPWRQVVVLKQAQNVGHIQAGGKAGADLTPKAAGLGVKVDDTLG